MSHIFSPNFDERVGTVSILLLHYTGMKTADEARARLRDPVAKVSAHYMIDEDGTVGALVPEDKRAWHAGLSYWAGERDINSASIGIELVNLGHEFGYCPFPELQINALIKLSQEILARHDIKYVLGHSDVAPARKTDPGELFPWADLAGAGIGRWPTALPGDNPQMDVDGALIKFGYDPECTPQERLIAFQRHFVPEVFTADTQGQICPLTRRRLLGLQNI